MIPAGAASDPADPAGLVDAVAAAVASCPSVARLSGGTLGEVATYLPGRRVSGVRVTEDGGIEVHVVAHYGPPVASVAAEVRAAVAAVAGLVPITVGVDDLELTPAAPAPRVR